MKSKIDILHTSKEFQKFMNKRIIIADKSENRISANQVFLELRSKYGL